MLSWRQRKKQARELQPAVLLNVFKCHFVFIHPVDGWYDLRQKKMFGLQKGPRDIKKTSSEDGMGMVRATFFKTQDFLLISSQQKSHPPF